MADDTKKPKADTTPKKEAAAKAESPAAKVESPAAKETSKDTPKEAAKADGGEAAARSSYSRGEGQKPVTAAYKENWNAIFGKKRTKKRR
jgi:hypothetical protein